MPVSALIFTMLSASLRRLNDLLSIPSQVSNSQASVSECLLGSSLNLSTSFDNCNFFLNMMYGFLHDLQNSAAHRVCYLGRSPPRPLFGERSVCPSPLFSVGSLIHLTREWLGAIPAWASFFNKVAPTWMIRSH